VQPAKLLCKFDEQSFEELEKLFSFYWFDPIILVPDPIILVQDVAKGKNMLIS